MIYLSVQWHFVIGTEIENVNKDKFIRSNIFVAVAATTSSVVIIVDVVDDDDDDGVVVA